MDCSRLPQVEQAMEEIGISFWYEGTNDRSLPQILADSGVNLARLRLFHTPGDGINGLGYTLDLAKRLDSAGVDGIMVNIHFSDTWADGNQQTKPAAWKGLSFDDLADRVQTYTESIVKRFIKRNIEVTAVQLGSDVASSGMLWPEGRVGRWPYDSESQWKHPSECVIVFCVFGSDRK